MLYQINIAIPMDKLFLFFDFRIASSHILNELHIDASSVLTHKRYMCVLRSELSGNNAA